MESPPPPCSPSPTSSCESRDHPVRKNPTNGASPSHLLALLPSAVAPDSNIPRPCKRMKVKEEPLQSSFTSVELTPSQVNAEPLQSSFTSVELTPSREEQENSLPIGLKLSTTPSFLELIEHSCGSTRTGMARGMDARPITDAAMHGNDVEHEKEKLKASNFSASLLRIGSWERKSLNEGDLVAKCYFAKHRLVWETLDNGLKSKIEIQWNDISAIRATTCRGKSILEVELERPPHFFRESDPQPRKHTQWKQVDDFTGGQATICRRHYVEFLQGILEKHYGKLLECDSRLRGLSTAQYPTSSSPYFPSDRGTEELIPRGDIFPPIDCTHEISLLRYARTSLRGHETYNLQCISSKGRMCTEEEHLGKSYPTSEACAWQQLQAVQEHLLGDQELPTCHIDEQKLLERVRSMDSLIQPDDGGNDGQLREDHKHDGHSPFFSNESSNR